MKLPPLACLRAFEAAVRTGGFARAADELALTPNAVAHQVKQLEEWLDMRLFERHARGVVPTPAGSAYAAAVADTFEQLSAATRQLLVRRDDRVVTVTAMPSLVTRWLMPRLPRLAIRHPDIEVRVLASVKHVDLFHGEADVAIRLGRGPYPGLASEELLIENFVAVASPRFLEAHPNLATPADLFRLPLLHDEMIDALPDEVDWPKWFEAVGVKPPRRLAGHLFSHTYLTLEAAIAGQGVALAGEHILGDAITSGRLRVLFDGLSVKGPYQYHLVRLPGAEVRPAVAAVCDWVREEARVA